MSDQETSRQNPRPCAAIPLLRLRTIAFRTPSQRTLAVAGRISYGRFVTDVKIVSLLPSATEIIGALGLADQIVGITHECDVCPDAAGLERLLDRGVARVTTSQINPALLPQSAIDQAVKSSLSAGLSLYALREDELRAVQPTLVVTQALCSVCAPAYDDVQEVCRRLGAGFAEIGGTVPEVVNLEPSTLAEVGQTFLTLAAAAGVPERGLVLRAEFERKLAAVREVATDVLRPRPTVLLLEWLEPPFSAGHWVPEQVEAAGAIAVTGTVGGKSRELSWAEVEAADPDVVVVACCGFDLARNQRDAEALLSISNPSTASRRLRALRAVRQGRIFAVDGNRYFARPGPSLAEGAALLARCVLAAEPERVARLEALGFVPREGEGWARLQPQSVSSGALAGDGAKAAVSTSAVSTSAWQVLHERACAAGELSYIDPLTGYRVFTRLGLEQRGRCCGCGCRHCPYAHVNVSDKAAKIQQPAFLHRSSTRATKRHVLFWSGGKDSLLALRVWVRRHGQSSAAAVRAALDSLVLLTTFDAKTRIVAHQEVSIFDIQRQAQALDLDLLAVPLHPSTEYLERVRAGLEQISAEGGAIESLIFGDLHLEHVKEWRDTALAQFELTLDYPLWQVPASTLLDDLESSGVPCVLSACPGQGDETLPGVGVGARFDRSLAASVQAQGWDPFGENGEFHTLAEVWQVPRERALGL